MDPMHDLATLLLIKLDPEWSTSNCLPPLPEGDRPAPPADPAETNKWEPQFRQLLLEHGQLTSGGISSATSLRVRADLVVEALYDNPDAALWATRYVQRYPSYIAELARAKAERVTPHASPDERAAAEIDWADLFIQNPGKVNSIADELDMPRPFQYVLRLELAEIGASRKLRGVALTRATTSVPPPEKPIREADPHPSHLLELAVTAALRLFNWALGSRDDSASQHLRPNPPRTDEAADGLAPAVRPRLLKQQPAAKSRHVLRRAHGLGLAGLCLSGGGIRSATFSLGAMHALAELDLLRRIDYLSTVSGGGYIGSWFVTWAKRLRGGVREVQQRLCPSRAAHPASLEQRPIAALREYSNYLTPRVGVFSADTWTMVVVWFRNTLLNQLVVVPFLAALLALPRVIAWFGQTVLLDRSAAWHASASGWIAGFGGRFGTLGTYLPGLPLAVFLIAVALAVLNIGRNLQRFDVPGHRDTEHDAPRPLGDDNAGVNLRILLPVIVAGFAAAMWIYQLLQTNSGALSQHAASGTFRFAPDDVRMGLTPLEWQIGVIAAAVIWSGLVALQFAGDYARCVLRERHTFKAGLIEHMKIASFGLVAAAAGGVLAALTVRFVHRADDSEMFWYSITLLPPAFSTALGAAVLLHIGLLGRTFPDERREWWSRLGAQHLRATLVWLGAFTIALLAPLIARLTWELLPLAVTWVGGTWVGVIAGKSPATKEDGVQPKGKGSIRRFVALAGPYIFIAGLLVAVSVLVFKIILQASCEGTLCAAPFREQLTRWALLPTDAISPLVVFGVALGASVFLSWRVDVNEFSMHHFYKNRLVRCYLGASRDRAARRPNRFTGFDPMDDEKLMTFLGRNGYAGPYPIVNTALNLSKGADLAWQERKAESFTFTPRFVGYDVEESRAPQDSAVKRAGYRPTQQFAYREGPGIGTAVAISGAAANPNMGYHSSPATAFLLTLFNARLGWWVGNPRHRETWRNQSPRFGLGYLTKELVGRTDNRSNYINISDGGHFENLGLYELVRRRCRYIIVIDGEQDGEMAFGGLANAIRKCRADFGVHIAIDLDDLRPEARLSRVHCALGRIHYPERSDRPGEARERGYLLYIKSSLTGDEPADILEYRAREPLFPHQSTGDQWFNESQFESYRMLGYHVTMEALKLAVKTQLKPESESPLEAVFSYLPYLWTPGLQPDVLLRHSEEYTDIFERVRHDPQLAALDRMMYAKYDADPRVRDRNELYIAHAIIDLMHRVFMDLKLDRFGKRPHNAGWMQIFRQWARLEPVIVAWEKVKDTYSPRFQAFFKTLRD